MAEKLRIVVLGYIVRGPVGGMAWLHMQYVLGLSRLGHEVYFLEDSGDYPLCYDPSRDVTDNDATYGLKFAADVFARIGLESCWAYYDAVAAQWTGPQGHNARQICASADLLLDLSPGDPMRPWFQQIPRRALIDVDPVFTQIRHLQDPAAAERASHHTSFFSFAENIDKPGRGAIPDDGLPWQATRPPIVTEAWPVVPAPDDGKFTTVMLWDSYRKLEYDGRSYGMKSDSFGPYLDLPGRTEQTLELAVGSPTTPWQQLRDHGWLLRNPLEVTRDPWTFQEYIQRSKAEFAVAKQGYVMSRGGWFSERSAAYLASGRPVLAQDTAFSSWLPTGCGLLAFRDPDEALAGIDEINGRYLAHCRAAKEIADQYFDFRTVLPSLIERGGRK